MREYVKGGRSGVPNAAVEPESVLGNAGKVYYAEIRTVVGPGVSVVGVRLAQIIEACPDELPEIPGVVICKGEVDVRNIAP